MKRTVGRSTVAMLGAAGLVLAACGSDESGDADEPAPAPAEADDAEAAGQTSEEPAAEPAAEGDLPTIVVTTNILGDVVEEVVGDSAEVVTIMPVGADPHDFQASAQEVNTLMSADALIVNGGAFEEGLLDVIENAEAEGVPTFEAMSVVETIEFGEGGHDHSDEEHSDEEHSDEEHSDEEHLDEEKDEDHDHSDEEHSDEEHSDEEKDEDHDHSDEEHSDEEHSDEEHSDEDHDHDHSGDDPHFFTDPMRMADAVGGIVEFLQVQVEFADPAALEASAAAYVEELTAVDAEVAAMVETIPEGQRVLVTNHEVFGYFADRYGFEVVGAVIPGGSTTDSASAGEIAELAETIADEGVPAIFSDTSSSDELIQVLAGEVGDIAVVELYTESLGEPGSDGETYLAMVMTNGERISTALA